MACAEKEAFITLCVKFIKINRTVRNILMPEKYFNIYLTFYLPPILVVSYRSFHLAWRLSSCGLIPH